MEFQQYHYRVPKRCKPAKIKSYLSTSYTSLLQYFYTRGNSFSLSDSNPHQQESGSPAIIAGSVMGVVVVAGAAIALVIVALVVLRRQSAAESTPLLDS